MARHSAGRHSAGEPQAAGARKRRGGGWLYLIPAIIMVAGLCVLLYPQLSNYQYEQGVDESQAAFEEWAYGGSAESDASADDAGSAGGDSSDSSTDNSAQLQALYEELQRRNEELYETGQEDLVDAWSYEQTTVDLSEYGVPDNTIGYLSIPALDCELPILLGASEENMSLGAVHLTETSYPIGGENTNCVIAAHRGYSQVAMFRNIQILEVGDLVYIENFRETLVYQVCETKVIDPEDIDEVLIQEGRDLVTLITCHPYRHNYQRYVVYCERVPSEDVAAVEAQVAAAEADEGIAERASDFFTLLGDEGIAALGVILLALLVVVVSLIVDARRRSRRRRAAAAAPAPDDVPGGGAGGGGGGAGGSTGGGAGAP